MTQAGSGDFSTTFLTSVFNPPKDGFFQGYCFLGSDLIFGESGAEQYTEQTGQRITRGLDGCYVLVQRSGTSYLFDTDYAGYKILYYYHDGELWCVSNSFAQMIDFLRAHKVEISPNYPHLAGIKAPGSGSSQLFSFETIVRGVRVAPRASTMIVEPHKVSFKPWPPVPQMAYEEGLSQHLDIWVSRYETMMVSDQTNFTIDVTGGVDSRTNLALTLSALRRTGKTEGLPRLNCGSSPGNTLDLEVATALTQHYGLELNDQRRFRGNPLSAYESYQTYRDLNTGVYYPLYMPIEGPSPLKIQIGGGGGEIHRRFYENHIKSKDPVKFYNNYARRIEPRAFKAEFIRDAIKALEIATPKGTDPLRAHYREFRHRYHVGRSPRYAVNFTPLDSVSADIAQSQAGADRLDEGQFNYDVIHSLTPELLEMPYDSVTKAPNTGVRERLTSVLLPRDAKPGRVWAPEPQPERMVRASQVERVKILEEAFEEAAASTFTENFWGQPYITEARELVQTLVAGGSVGNAVNAKPISAILSAYLARPS